MRIYTRRGDRGETSLFGGKRVRKHDMRVEACGAVDELNAVIGVAAGEVAKHETRQRLGAVQSDLFALGARLATPEPDLDSKSGGRPVPRLPQLPAGRVAEMEAWIDQADAETPPLRHFILPAGAAGARHLHFARTVCRRTERRVARLADDVPTLDPVMIRYLNRLSDYLFAAARAENAVCGEKDVKWRGSW